MNVARNVGYGLRQRKVDKAEETRLVGEALELVRLGGYGQAPGVGDVGRPAAASRARPGPREPTHGPAPRRAARCPRPQAPQGDAARAQVPPARGRDHLCVRDPRSGGGADDERHDHCHARRSDPTGRRSRGAVRATGEPLRRRFHRHVQFPEGRSRRGRRRRPAHGPNGPGPGPSRPPDRSRQRRSELAMR